MEEKEKKDMKLCECGCGQPTTIIKDRTHKKRGRIKGEYNRFIRGHHNRGKHPTLKTRKKMSKTHTGMKKPWVIAIMKAKAGEKNHLWKDGRCNKQYYCKDCGRKICLNTALYGNGFCNYCSHKGERTSNWQGGVSFEPYTSDFNRQLKDRIRVRDNFICQLCGVPELECNERLSIHHIDYNKKNCEKSNLISLCRSCNTKVNFNKKYYQRCFKKKLISIFNEANNNKPCPQKPKEKS